MTGFIPGGSVRVGRDRKDARKISKIGFGGGVEDVEIFSQGEVKKEVIEREEKEHGVIRRG